jgi:hypothetical protein
VARALRIDADHRDPDIAIRAAGGTGDLAVQPSLTRDERGTTANKRGFEEIFAGPSFHEADVLLGMELMADNVAARRG